MKHAWNIVGSSECIEALGRCVGSLFTFVMAWWFDDAFEHGKNVSLSCIMHYYFLLFSFSPSSHSLTFKKRSRCNTGRISLLVYEKLVISLKTLSWHQKVVHFPHELIRQVERCLLIQYCGELSSYSFLNIHRKRIVKR